MVLVLEAATLKREESLRRRNKKRRADLLSELSCECRGRRGYIDRRQVHERDFDPAPTGKADYPSQFGPIRIGGRSIEKPGWIGSP